MAQMTNVLIGIQARSTSKRFPRKSFAMLGDKPLLQHVIDACNKAALYCNKFSYKENTFVNVAVLCPNGDEIAEAFRGKVKIVQGDEQDVLSRYVKAAERFNADYIVRITADCVLIPPHLITKHIKTAVQNRHDYLSNVDERIRTSFDGLDCEAMSRKALDWLAANAKDAAEKEHVTLKLRESPPDWLNVGHVVGYLDLSGLKLSVDTPEDLERVRKHYEAINNAIDTATKIFGERSVHRF